MEPSSKDKMLHFMYTDNYSCLSCHPNSPAGGGGPGFFRQATPLGTDSTKYVLPHPFSPAGMQVTQNQITQAQQDKKNFSLMDIPYIMKQNGWKNGAILMASWFNRKACSAPQYDTPDETTIKMSWVIGFARAKEVYDKLVSVKIWQNEAARKELYKNLKTQGLLSENNCFSRSFGDLNLPASKLNEESVNYRAVSMSWKNALEDLDDMSASLGNFVFKVAVSGRVTGDDDPNGYKVEILKVGIFIRDSFDFNGDQFLGYWDRTDNSVSSKNPFNGVKVTNDDFREWRNANGKGGDFLVFSDVTIIALSTPDIFFIK